MRVGITGHRGLSTEVEERVRALLADAVSGYDATEPVAVSCIADGPDAWFAEAVLSAGGRLEVVVPATASSRPPSTATACRSGTTPRTTR
jgi:hypothetical protein